MRSDKNLDKRAKEFIWNAMEDHGEITVDEVVEIMRPHFMFDVDSAREAAIRSRARSMLASFHDHKGVRTCYSDNKGLFINIDTTNNLPSLLKVKVQLENKYVGLNNALKKVRKREQILKGQISLYDVSGR